MAGHERRAFTRTEVLEALGRMSRNVRRVTMRAVRVRRAGSERHADMYGFGTVDPDQMLSRLKEDLDNELVYLKKAKDKMQQYSSEILGNIKDADGREI
jgi:hypothetical protein